jgi:Sulfatase
MKTREAARWALASLPLAPVAAIVYLCFEWLFFVTKPSATAGLTFGAQLLVLLKSPQPILLPLLAVQAVASLMSLVAYPRLRGLAVAPAAVISGVLLLILIDNFTYTVFGFGMLTAGEPLRIVYAALLPVLVTVAGWKLAKWFGTAFLSRSLIYGTACLALLFASPPVAATVTKPPREPSLAPPPDAQGSRGPSSRPNILFLGIDGVDAAILSVYGYERQTTPFLESIRDQTLFFENAFTNATRTHGSLVTLLTGRLPFHTRVTFPPTVLQGEDSRRNLPMILKGLGYTTLQVGMRHYADAEDVNLMGFDAANYRWQNLEEVKPGEGTADETDVFRSAVAERLDERLGRLFGMPPVTDGFAHVEGRAVAVEWRDERRVATLERYFHEAREPWFVHLHMLDTHCCNYNPDQMHFSGGRTAQTDERDSQVREADQKVARLFAALKSSGRLERTVVVISSDHTSQWKSTERIPLMIRFPGTALKGRVAANVQTADVAPTMLAYLGAAVPEWMDGLPLTDPGRLSDDRRIFGVSDILRREGVPGLRLLLDSGPPNYGAAAAMLVQGDQWFDLRFETGVLSSGRVFEHTRPSSTVLTEVEARRAIEAVLDGVGFRVTQTGPDTKRRE